MRLPDRQHNPDNAARHNPPQLPEGAFRDRVRTDAYLYEAEPTAVDPGTRFTEQVTAALTGSAVLLSIALLLVLNRVVRPRQ